MMTRATVSATDLVIQLFTNTHKYSHYTPNGRKKPPQPIFFTTLGRRLGKKKVPGLLGWPLKQELRKYVLKWTDTF